jgi:hypothetical protein
VAGVPTRHSIRAPQLRPLHTVQRREAEVDEQLEEAPVNVAAASTRARQSSALSVITHPGY